MVVVDRRYVGYVHSIAILVPDEHGAGGWSTATHLTVAMGGVCQATANGRVARTTVVRLGARARHVVPQGVARETKSFLDVQCI